MVTSDMARTEPAAGMTVNSVGRALRSPAVWPCQFFRDTSDACLALLTLGEPKPSPRTRKAKVIGTKEVLKRVQIDVSGKPVQRERQRGGGVMMRESRTCLGTDSEQKENWIWQYIIKYILRKFKVKVTHQRLHLQNWALKHWSGTWVQWHSPWNKRDKSLEIEQ